MQFAKKRKINNEFLSANKRNIQDLVYTMINVDISHLISSEKKLTPKQKLIKVKLKIADSIKYLFYAQMMHLSKIVSSLNYLCVCVKYFISYKLQTDKNKQRIEMIQTSLVNCVLMVTMVVPVNDDLATDTG